MRLSEIVSQIPGACPRSPGDPEVTGVTCDSRRVSAGDLFVAVRGSCADGHRFAGRAARAGAAACLVEREVDAPGAVQVRVPDTGVALGLAACAFWGHPSRQLRLVGITGTNGKTTVAYLVSHLLSAAGTKVGRLGTISYAFPGGEEPAPLTTPDAPALQAALGRMVREGAHAGVMEVSSHALDRRRVEGCRFACVVFTNLTQDHLDYHDTMETYYGAKRLLFTRHAPGAPAVVNAEDPFGRRLAGEVPGPVVTWGVAAGDVRLSVEASDLDGLRGEVWAGAERHPVRVPLVGAFNASNAACALATARALGVDLGLAAEALATAPPVPGRLEPVPNDRGLAVFVDYAHTPDALDRVLAAVRALDAGRLVCVFGCGGDRDRGKRPWMARAAARWCDKLVLTADNSRSEPTAAILDEIEAGLPDGWARVASARALAGADRVYARLEDRAEAIAWAVSAARPGDAVVIAGKGHETTQTLGGRVLAFDDRVVARNVLAGGGP